MAHAEVEKKALGRDLAQARKDAGFTMEGAATELTRRGFPITKQTIGAWEVGRNLPDTLWLRRLARLYRTSIDVLTGNAARADWPLSEELHQKVLTLSDEALTKLENVMRAHLDMPQETSSDFTDSRKLDTTSHPTHHYDFGQEEGIGVPDHIAPPKPKQHVSSSKNQRSPHAKGRGGA